MSFRQWKGTTDTTGVMTLENPTLQGLVTVELRQDSPNSSDQLSYTNGCSQVIDEPTIPKWNKDYDYSLWDAFKEKIKRKKTKTCLPIFVKNYLTMNAFDPRLQEQVERRVRQLANKELRNASNSITFKVRILFASDIPLSESVIVELAFYGDVYIHTPSFTLSNFHNRKYPFPLFSTDNKRMKNSIKYSPKKQSENENVQTSAYPSPPYSSSSSTIGDSSTSIRNTKVQRSKEVRDICQRTIKLEGANGKPTLQHASPPTLTTYLFLYIIMDFLKELQCPLLQSVIDTINKKLHSDRTLLNSKLINAPVVAPHLFYVASMAVVRRREDTQRHFEAEMVEEGDDRTMDAEMEQADQRDEQGEKRNTHKTSRKSENDIEVIQDFGNIEMKFFLEKLEDCATKLATYSDEFKTLKEFVKREKEASRDTLASASLIAKSFEPLYKAATN